MTTFFADFPSRKKMVVALLYDDKSCQASLVNKSQFRAGGMALKVVRLNAEMCSISLGNRDK